MHTQREISTHLEIQEILNKSSIRIVNLQKIIIFLRLVQSQKMENS